MPRRRRTARTAILAVTCLALLGWCVRSCLDDAAAGPAPRIEGSESPSDPDLARARVGTSEPRGATKISEDERRPAQLDPTGAAPATEQPTTFSGLVREIGGPPAAGIHVAIETRDGEELDHAITDEKGRFELASRPPRSAFLFTLGHLGHGPKLRHRFLSSPKGPPPTLWIPPLQSISGTVIDGTGQPVAGIAVSTDRINVMMFSAPFDYVDSKPPPMTGVSERTGADGRFLLPSTPHGTHHLRAMDEAGTTVCSATVQAGDREVLLRLGTNDPTLATLTGHVLDGTTGTGIEGLRLHANLVKRSRGGSSSRGVASAITEANGSYRMEGLPPGEYRIEHHPKAYTAYTSSIFQVEGRGTEHDVTLWPTRSLRVHVHWPDGRSTPRAQVFAVDERGRRLELRDPGPFRPTTESIRTDTEGRARLDGLPARTVEIRAIRHDLQPAAIATIDLTEPPGDELQLRLPCAPLPSARVHYCWLRDTNDKPIEVARDAVVHAEVWLDGRMVSAVQGRWTDRGFAHGHGLTDPHPADHPRLALLVPNASCEIRVRAPGYYDQTVELAAAAKSPSVIRLRR